MLDGERIIPYYSYAFKRGPLPRGDLSRIICEGNCRLLLQLYFYQKYGKYFSEEELLNPNGYLNTGEFIKKEPEHRGADYFDDLPDECVIYAEKTTNDSGASVDFSVDSFNREEDYLVRLHSAIYVKNYEKLRPLVSPEMPVVDVLLGDKAILHATAIQGSTTVWSIDKFLQHYKPVAAKKFL